MEASIYEIRVKVLSKAIITLVGLLLSSVIVFALIKGHRHILPAIKEQKALLIYLFAMIAILIVNVLNILEVYNSYLILNADGILLKKYLNQKYISINEILDFKYFVVKGNYKLRIILVNKKKYTFNFFMKKEIKELIDLFEKANK